MKDLIVLLPGILGSVLHKDGKPVWAASASAGMRALLTGGQSLQSLAVVDDQWDQDLDDGVTAESLMPDVHLVPGFWKIDGYSKVSARLQQAFQLERGKNFFEFPYDWRRDNRASALELQKRTAAWLKAWRGAGHDDARLILIAHSMGGLVSRYFLECLEGWRDTRLLITFGTPYRGSLNAFDNLTNGIRIGPVAVDSLTQLVRSLTSVHQLLPMYKCYDSGDGQLVRVGEVLGIPNVEAERARQALSFHREIARAVDEHGREEVYSQGGYEIKPVIGTHQPTWQSARRDGDSVLLSREYEGDLLDGDGTVPRVSALPLEMKGGGIYAANCHSSLQNADAVLAQVEGTLYEGSIDFGSFRGARISGISLAVEDACFDQDPVVIRARPEVDHGVLEAMLENLETGESTPLKMTVGPDGWYASEEASQPVGTYRVTIRSQGASPVHDVFMVLER